MKYITKIYAKHIQSLDDCDNTPVVIEGVEIYDNQGNFIPSIQSYKNPGKVWIYNLRSGWYSHLKSGIKLKKEVFKSPDYDPENNKGNSTITITIKIPVPDLPDLRGTNPNSHHNKKRVNGINRVIRLSEEQWDLIFELGDGNYSRGIRNLIDDKLSD